MSLRNPITFAYTSNVHSRRIPCAKYQRINTLMVRSGLQQSARVQISTNVVSAVKEVTIIGGGLGGLLAAIALHQVGLKVQVYEREAERAASEGTLITLWPNGLKAVGVINPAILEKIKEYGALPTKFRGKSLAGIIQTEMDVDLVPKYGQPGVFIRWSTILDIFNEFLPVDSLKSGFRFTGRVEQENDEVTAVFLHNGKEVEVKTPFLIGADGINSLTRQAVLEDKTVSPRDNGRSVWRFIVPDGVLDLEGVEKLTSTFMIGPGRIITAADTGEGFFYFSFVVTDEFAVGENLKERTNSAQESKARLLRLFTDIPFATAVINEVKPESIIERRVMDLPVLPKWWNGRIVLIGDAAHAVTPTMGQGANLAFEDVLELTRQIVSHSSLDDALEAFQQRQMPRIEMVVAQNQQSAKRAYSDGRSQSMESFVTIYNYERLEEAL